MNPHDVDMPAEFLLVRLGGHWLAHLAREEILLGRALASLRRVRAALLHNDLPELAAALGEQTVLAQDTEAVRQARVDLLLELALALDLSFEESTLSVLLDRLPAKAAQPLADYRERLRKLAREADSLNRGNAALVNCCLGFVQRLLSDLTGGEANGERYTPAGKHSMTAYGTLVRARG